MINTKLIWQGTHQHKTANNNTEKEFACTRNERLAHTHTQSKRERENDREFSVYFVFTIAVGAYKVHTHAELTTTKTKMQISSERNKKVHTKLNTLNAKDHWLRSLAKQRAHSNSSENQTKRNEQIILRKALPFGVIIIVTIK